MGAENKIAQLFEKRFGTAPEKVEKLAGAGSNRLYFRLTGVTREGKPERVIGTVGTDGEENAAFVYLANHFSKSGLHVPEVLAVSDDGIAYLQTDLGDISLFDEISKGRACGAFDDYERQLLVETIKMLPHLQFDGSKGIEYDNCYPYRELDRRTVAGDLNYFKYDFLKPSGLEFSERRLDDELEQLEGMLLRCGAVNSGFMLRDFQSRNVMIYGNVPYVIDFQGGRCGPCAYDVASFLWQAKANIPQSLREELVEVYITEAKQVNPLFDETAFRESLPLFVLFRMLQTLGAYGFRGLIEGKAHFMQSIVPAINNLSGHLKKMGGDMFPYLTELSVELHNAPRIKVIEPLFSLPSFEGLTVIVSSFSYKKGIPVDPSGNGGGFVFDCRAIHNPGRYEPYKQLTGRDKAVKDFLENDGEIFHFLDHAGVLVENSVRRYLKRGFSSLTVNFGCTGGQHRSVYSAEAMAHKLCEDFPEVRVVLVHREQEIMEILNK